MATPSWMTNQDTSSHSVYLGYWINHSRGKILGATLTVTDSQGSLLIAFTALFISYVATRFWRIFCFVAHRHLSSPEPRDALHHQRQAILRNSSSAESSLWALLLLFTAWRGAENRVLRTIPLALFALVSVISFTIAGGLSSQISSSVGNEVLIRGENCGFLDSTHFTRDNKRIFDTYVSNSINNAGNWAQQCYYAEGRSGMLDCASFISKNLPAAFDENAPCPFQDSVCRTNSSNLRIDSGFLDSNDHLGLNAPADQRVQSRLVMHCAPLKTEGRDTTIWRRGGKYVLYDYGPVPPSWRENITTNFTMMAPDSQTQYNTSWGQIGAATYQLNTMIAYIENGTWNPKQASFRPYPDIFRSDADLILVFLVGNGVVFDKPLDDDWYRATAPARNLTLFALDNITNIPSYRPVDAASPMGCIQQYQFCNTALTNVPEKERCSPLASMADAVTAALPLFNSSVEEFNNFTATSPVASQFVWLTTLLMTMVNDASTVIRVQGAHALDSKRTLFAGSQGAALPRDQWKRDVGLWWSTQMAQIQSAVVQSAMGTVDEDMLQVWTKAEGVLSGGEVCANQKIRNNNYTNFSLLGLLATLLLGILTILTSWLLEPLHSFLHRRRGYKSYKYLSWTSSETLQLQRQGYELTGANVEWTHCTRVVPRTKPGEKLPGLDVTESAHPRLEVKGMWFVGGLRSVGSGSGSLTGSGSHEGYGKGGAYHVVEGRKSE